MTVRTYVLRVPVPPIWCYLHVLVVDLRNFEIGATCKHGRECSTCCAILADRDSQGLSAPYQVP